MQQVSYGPLIIMSCYIEFFNVRRGWQSLNTGTRFYVRLIRRTGWLWIYTSSPTDGRPFKPKKLSVPFLYPGIPVRLTPFRGLVPLWRRNLVPILLSAHTLGGGGLSSIFYSKGSRKWAFQNASNYHTNTCSSSRSFLCYIKLYRNHEYFSKIILISDFLCLFIILFLILCV